MTKAIFLLSLILIPVLTASTQDMGTRLCSDAPQGLPTFNPDWYYSEFQIPEDALVTSLYGGFNRPGYIPAHYDYIAQFYRDGETITSLDDFQLFNYDLIDEPLYNREFDIRHLGIIGGGTLRLSAPLTHGVQWNQGCVSFETLPTTESVPEPAAIALLFIGLVALLSVKRRMSPGA